MKRFIAGIDPGTTTAYALLNLDGSIAEMSSSKSYDLKNLLRTITRKGKVILIGTDKKNVPSFVYKTAAKLGAALVWPREDLKVDEKKEQTRPHDFHDDHQRDALASALFAFHQFRNLFDKIDNELREKEKEEYSSKVKEIMIKNSRYNISTALLIAEKPTMERLEEIGRKLEQEKAPLPEPKCDSELEKKIVHIRNELRKTNEKSRVMEKTISSPKQQLSEAKKYRQQLEDKYYSKKDFSQAERIKENRIKIMSQKIDILEKGMKQKDAEIRMISELFASGRYYPLKRLDNLGYDEFKSKAKALEFCAHDMLFVRDATVASHNVVDELKKKISLIIYEKGPNKHLPFLQVESKGMEIVRTEYFVFVLKKELDRKKNTVELIQNIIDLHKKERE